MPNYYTQNADTGNFLYASDNFMLLLFFICICVTIVLILALKTVIKTAKKGSAAAMVQNEPAVVSIEPPGIPPAAPTVSVPNVSGNRVSLVNVDEPTAAMLMAIVAYELNCPVETVHFKAIKAIS